MRVYVAGPISRGDQAANVRQAIDAADALLVVGYVPFVPHLAHLWHLLYPHGYEEWMRWDAAWLAQCQALVRLPGESPGADREVAWARSHSIPVFCSVSALLASEARCDA